MLFFLLFIVVIVLEITCLACYLFAPFCRGGKRPLIAKCACAGLFILIGVFAIQASGNFTIYAKLMLCGLFFSALGDYFLGVAMKGKILAAGIVSFMAAHGFYIAAFSKTIAARFPGSSFFSPYEWLAAGFFLLLMAVASVKLKMNMGSYKILISLYTAVITVMLVKAVSLGARYYTAGLKNAPAAAVLVIGGAFLFVLSDAVLSLSLFASKNTRSMTVLNLITYFSAQTLLACSIYFIVV